MIISRSIFYYSNNYSLLQKSIHIDSFVYSSQICNKLFLSFRRKHKVRSIFKINTYPVKRSGWSR